jgi:GNAT superfamily N-acetyltransferase
MKALQHFMTPNGQCTIFMATSKQDGAEFWTLMGPWFAAKQVTEALGEPVYDHDGMVWALAIINERVIGFGAIDLSHSEQFALLNYGFMAEECRGTGIYKRLLEARVKLIQEDTECPLIKALCTAESAPVLAKLGFTEKSKRGRYTWFVKEIKR